MFNIIRTRIKEGIKTKKIVIKKDNLVFMNDKNLKELKICFKKNASIIVADSGSCNACLHELSALTNPYYDMERFGFKYVASPKHADILIVTGCVTRNMYLSLLKTYENIPNPKVVIAVGDCALTGGVFKDTYATLGGGSQSLFQVSLLIKGCPPEPIDIISGLLTLFESRL
jgi:Ni,Fe-hydrogenase III small subunit